MKIAIASSTPTRAAVVCAGAASAVFSATDMLSPDRAIVAGAWRLATCGGKTISPRAFARGLFEFVVRQFADVLGRTGSDLLSRGLGRSTMCAGGFNGRVRNGFGWFFFAWFS